MVGLICFRIFYNFAHILTYLTRTKEINAMIKGARACSCNIRMSKSILPVVIGCGLSLLTAYGRERLGAFVLLMAASALHEWGHWAMARVMNVPLVEFRLDLLGARLKTQGALNYVQEWWLSAGGPLFNFLSVALILPIWIAGVEGALHCPSWLIDQTGTFLAASLGLGALNLMPIDTFDGGRMLYCFLALFAEETTANRISQWVSLLCLSLLWMLSVYVLLRVGRSLSMFVFSFTLLYRGLTAFYET